ncbi:MAG TPA: transaldolase [Candidatus Sulfotelmatobacter sp.]|jgi:transaldolase/glucose-6-phosphate isomerase|nr:transaldolase [Candidatus Sulfotelmatobacter sp.]
MQPTGVLESSRGTTNPVKELLNYGQSMWLDYIRRDLITSGALKKMIEDDGLRGMTSNPSIFEKAIAESSLYDDILKSLASRNDLDTTARYEQIAIRDIQGAADVLRPVYDSSKCRDGYVSLEVSPLLARKTEETIEEARRLWKAVNRENVMIKIPGTAEGLPAIRQAIGEGINVNVTLLFAQEVYEKVAEAHIAGLEDLAKRGGNLKKIGGVASFFISRIDSLVDSMINDKLKATTDAQQQTLLKGLLGKVAIANGKLTYQRYQRIFSGPRWQALAAQGAQTQRVLWASTSTKNPAYRDVMYVEELIGPDTVNTMPPATIDAFRDHGKLRNSLTEDVAGAQKVMDDLAKVGISIKEVTTKLTDDGVKLFADAFHKLLAAVEKSTQLKGKTA